MPFVGTGFGGHGDHAARAMAGLGIDAVLRYHHFLDRIGVGRITALMTETDRAAVHLKIVGQVGAAAQIDAVHRPRSGTAASRRAY